MAERFPERKFFEGRQKLKYFNSWIVIWIGNYLSILTLSFLMNFNGPKILSYQNFALASFGKLWFFLVLFIRSEFRKVEFFLSHTIHKKLSRCWSYFISDLISSNGGERVIREQILETSRFLRPKIRKKLIKMLQKM